jgi:hypothetical protein
MVYYDARRSPPTTPTTNHHPEEKQQPSTAIVFHMFCLQSLKRKIVFIPTVITVFKSWKRVMRLESNKWNSLELTQIISRRNKETTKLM